MIQIQDTLIYIHSVLRWLILSLAVFGIARSFVSMLSVSARFSRLDLGVSRAYPLLLDLQLLVGVLLVLAALTLQQLADVAVHDVLVELEFLRRLLLVRRPLAR